MNHPHARRRRPFRALATLLLALAAAPAVAATCGSPGQWLAAEGKGVAPLPPAAVIERMARQQAVLLGESHDSAEDHRWQLHTLAALYARRPALAVGFEMFPRRLQPVLDQWVAGALTEQAFLERVEWDKVWGFDARDYLPLFHFARMNRLPMLALDVERSLADAVAKAGWDAVAEPRKEGVSRPAAPSADYLKELRAAFDEHPDRPPGEAAFQRFVEAQALRDRAMAQAMAEHLRRQPEALVAAILGAGHVRQGHGVAHQLKDLGIAGVGSLITWNEADDCAHLTPGLADAAYVVEPPAGRPPRLGIAMDADPAGVRITAVTAGSVAERAGLRRGDLVVEVAGQAAQGMQGLRAAVQRQAPGTWLPLKVRRGDDTLELVARFPPAP